MQVLFCGEKAWYGTVYDCTLRTEQIVEQMPLGTEVIPLQSPLLWCKYYRLMGRTEKAEMIEKAEIIEKAMER